VFHEENVLFSRVTAKVLDHTWMDSSAKYVIAEDGGTDCALINNLIVLVELVI